MHDLGNATGIKLTTGFDFVRLDRTCERWLGQMLAIA